MRRAKRGIVATVALALVAALITHEVLAHVIARSGSEAVGVALGPGTPLGEIVLMGGFVAARTGLYLLGPGVVAAVAVALLVGPAR